ncbi:aminotransferase class I/II-fold pyridoxal phosphate-dependent enzyme [Alteromonas lipolytica]|uniref:8-amino-7-oxononanoate synthase n=1 Tax=Alteromonas lipolytica TaxID=1856405 RepID=A0A1E8FEN3_9ALTE|nr:8-amino-7-oxononanoate synthase [Alteromonas lipolytica]OFI34380.1 8-amino-7-oxononanoate synthase [Alteromonas lipolytica]GGF81956.1 8-amino-7-oxononanoate synthase [Alteromonas lipolytica]
MAFDYIDSQLNERQQQGYYRQRTCIDYERDGIIAIDGQHYLNFGSNDYLGLRHDQGVLQAWVEGLAQFGAGSGASPLVTGYSVAHRELEATLAEALGYDAVLLFNSGFAANQAICQALFASSGEIIADKLMHASFIEGALASNGTLKRFAHNDMTHLQTLLAKAQESNRLIASEGVFSMDGDSPVIAELVSAAQQSQSWLMLDDAHAFGVTGEHGLGSVEQYDLNQHNCQIVMGTFGKAIGTAGAFVAGSHSLIDYLVNYARHYIYSTAFPPAQAVATIYALNCVTTGPKRAQLHGNIANFKHKARQEGLTLLESDSAIQPLIIGEPELARQYSAALAARGLWVPAMRHPTVPKGADRLRITLSAVHSEQDIAALVDALCLVRQELGRGAD